jgi:cruciform cutting endonuclease 1
MSQSAANALKSWHFKYWAFLTGLPSTGTKTELKKILLERASAGSKSRIASQRIVSVDMGIRNLAYCAIETPARSSTKYDGKPLSFKVDTWTRMDLAARMSMPAPTELEEEAASSEVDDEAKPKRRKVKAKSTFERNAFSPESLSTTAYKVTQELLALRPDAILIERQRFRSGGAAAIQEWTVRVNMLESMLWACLETLRETRSERKTFSSSPMVHAVEPARVARFWVPSEDVPLQPPSDLFVRAHAYSDGTVLRKKVEKKDKIAVVKSWITGESDVKIDFQGQAAEMAEAFRTEKVRGSARQIAGGKLDDLADCLLQGVAWVRWEENRRRIDHLWGEIAKEHADT